MKNQSIHPMFAMGDLVTHLVDPSATGVVVAFMLRGANQSFEVIWDEDKCRPSWHLGFELKLKGKASGAIGFNES